MGAIEIAASLAASRRAVRLYPPEHPTHREAIADLVATVTGSVDIRPLVLNLREGRLYEGSEVLTESSPAVRALAVAMEDRRVESLTFHTGFTPVDAEGLSEVMSLKPEPDLQVQVELETRGVRAVTVSELEDNSSLEAEERDRRREADRALYRHSLTALKNLHAALAEGRTEIETAEAVRGIAQIIDRIAEEPHAILALAQMTGHGEPWRFHAVSTMLHSLVLGSFVGLADRQLVSVGLAGLLHDIGSALSPDVDADALRLAHPLIGAEALGALCDEECASMIAAYEHHMDIAGGGGWPEHTEGRVLHPYSRIVAVANRYDHLIRGDAAGRLRPDEAAVQLVREASAGQLDQFLARLFVQAIGVFPVGCTVRLSDMSFGVVARTADDPLRPTLRMVIGPDGKELRPACDLDLTDDERQRTIVEVVPAALLGIQPSDVL